MIDGLSAKSAVVASRRSRGQRLGSLERLSFFYFNLQVKALLT
jgi:hypothetical protein